MRALAFEAYGGPERLSLVERPRPEPRTGEVLVRVEAASLNSWDADILAGDAVNRLLFGLRRPRRTVLGADIAGRVAVVGSGVTGLKVGDAVWGDLSGAAWGGFADYVRAPATALAPMPAGLSFEQAAATPQAGLLARQALLLCGGARPGQRVLVNGAGGGVGSFAIQLLRDSGAELTAVDRADKLDFLRRLGADAVLDCERTDFTLSGERYDLILDVMTRRPVRAYPRALAPGGTYITVGGPIRRLLALLAIAPPVRWATGKRLRLLAHRPNEGLAELGRLIEAGQVTPAVDRAFDLADGRAAFEYFASGAYQGKVVIRMTTGD